MRSRPVIPVILAVAVTLVASSCSKTDSAASSDTITLGVSGPVTGPNAEYGRLWKQGFDLALDMINAGDGVNGKKVVLQWEDSQSDPKQTVPIAQKFVDDGSVIAELGDFSSPASMAASPIYQRAGLVQFGFTNSHPDFTKGGDHMWSTSLTQDTLQRANAGFVAQKAKNIAVLYQQTDWGKAAFDVFSSEAKKLGLTIDYSAQFLPDSTDFRPLLIKARDAKPDAVVHLGYGPDGAAIVKQLRDVGYAGQFYGGQNTPEFIDLAGKAGEGDIITGAFSSDDPRPAVQKFVKAFKAKYNAEPGDFNLYAYDALITLAAAAEKGGATREGVQKALQDTAEFPSVQFGELKFDSQRRPENPTVKELVLTGGKFVIVDRKTSAG